MTVCIRTNYFNVSFQTRLPLYEETQLLKDATRNRLSDTCCIPAGYLGSEALPTQQVPTSHITSLRRHIFGCACFLSAQVAFLTHGLFRLNRKVFFAEPEALVMCRRAAAQGIMRLMKGCGAEVG